MQIPEAAIGPIIAAVIAGMVVFVSTMLSKEQKTSEFRQTWIDELRKDISEYISGTTELVALYFSKKSNKTEQDELINNNFELIHKLQTIEHRINLRLNPTKHEDLLSKIKKLREDLIEIYSKQTDYKIRKTEESRLIEDLLTLTKTILKKEWERVKKGEPAFKATKIIAISTTIIALLLITINVISPKTPNKNKEKESKNNEFSDTTTINNNTNCVYCVLDLNTHQERSPTE